MTKRDIVRARRPINGAVSRLGKWRLYWPGPLPQGAAAIGTVNRGNGEEGAMKMTADDYQPDARMIHGVLSCGKCGGFDDSAMAEIA